MRKCSGMDGKCANAREWTSKGRPRRRGHAEPIRCRKRYASSGVQSIVMVDPTVHLSELSTLLVTTSRSPNPVLPSTTPDLRLTVSNMSVSFGNLYKGVQTISAGVYKVSTISTNNICWCCILNATPALHQKKKGNGILLY